MSMVYELSSMALCSLGSIYAKVVGRLKHFCFLDCERMDDLRFVGDGGLNGEGLVGIACA